MGKYLEIPVGDKGTIFVDITPAEGFFPAGGGDVIEKVEGAFENAMHTVQVCTEGFFEHIKGFAEEISPQKVTIEFGISFGAEVGAVVTKASGEANFKVCLTWKDVNATKQELSK